MVSQDPVGRESGGGFAGASGATLSPAAASQPLTVSLAVHRWREERAQTKENDAKLNAMWAWGAWRPRSFDVIGNPVSADVKRSNVTTPANFLASSDGKDASMSLDELELGLSDAQIRMDLALAKFGSKHALDQRRYGTERDRSQQSVASSGSLSPLDGEVPGQPVSQVGHRPRVRREPTQIIGVVSKEHASSMSSMAHFHPVRASTSLDDGDRSGHFSDRLGPLSENNSEANPIVCLPSREGSARSVSGASDLLQADFLELHDQHHSLVDALAKAGFTLNYDANTWHIQSPPFDARVIEANSDLSLPRVDPKDKPPKERAAKPAGVRGADANGTGSKASDSPGQSPPGEDAAALEALATMTGVKTVALDVVEAHLDQVHDRVLALLSAAADAVRAARNLGQLQAGDAAADAPRAPQAPSSPGKPGPPVSRRNASDTDPTSSISFSTVTHTNSTSATVSSAVNSSLSLVERASGSHGDRDAHQLPRIEHHHSTSAPEQLQSGSDRVDAHGAEASYDRQASSPPALGALEWSGMRPKTRSILAQPIPEESSGASGSTSAATEDNRSLRRASVSWAGDDQRSRHGGHGEPRRPRRAALSSPRRPLPPLRTMPPHHGLEPDSLPDLAALLTGVDSGGGGRQTTSHYSWPSLEVVKPGAAMSKTASWDNVNHLAESGGDSKAPLPPGGVRDGTAAGPGPDGSLLSAVQNLVALQSQRIDALEASLEAMRSKLDARLPSPSDTPPHPDAPQRRQRHAARRRRAGGSGLDLLALARGGGAMPRVASAPASPTGRDSAADDHDWWPRNASFERSRNGQDGALAEALGDLATERDRADRCTRTLRNSIRTCSELWQLLVKERANTESARQEALYWQRGGGAPGGAAPQHRPRPGGDDEAGQHNYPLEWSIPDASVTRLSVAAPTTSSGLSEAQSDARGQRLERAAQELQHEVAGLCESMQGRERQRVAEFFDVRFESPGGRQEAADRHARGVEMLADAGPVADGAAADEPTPPPEAPRAEASDLSEREGDREDAPRGDESSPLDPADGAEDSQPAEPAPPPPDAPHGSVPGLEPSDGTGGAGGGLEADRLAPFPALEPLALQREGDDAAEMAALAEEQLTLTAPLEALELHPGAGEAAESEPSENVAALALPAVDAGGAASAPSDPTSAAAPLEPRSPVCGSSAAQTNVLPLELAVAALDDFEDGRPAGVCAGDWASGDVAAGTGEGDATALGGLTGRGAAVQAVGGRRLELEDQVAE